ncbi:hypothetical protein JCGZ_22918 [Jatropha curcas]|uniref:Uncharacterized protein n=1 Tax=Jatropha curcas TaxID=180498 RepID=A0A067LJ62_JATCU|nr:hypothetical protein JCGZ_22918 [Jatropha curcas]
MDTVHEIREHTGLCTLVRASEGKDVRMMESFDLVGPIGQFVTQTGRNWEELLMAKELLGKGHGGTDILKIGTEVLQPGTDQGDRQAPNGIDLGLIGTGQKLVGANQGKLLPYPWPLILRFSSFRRSVRGPNDVRLS